MEGSVSAVGARIRDKRGECLQECSLLASAGRHGWMVPAPLGAGTTGRKEQGSRSLPGRSLRGSRNNLRPCSPCIPWLFLQFMNISETFPQGILQRHVRRNAELADSGVHLAASHSFPHLSWAPASFWQNCVFVHLEFCLTSSTGTVTHCLVLKLWFRIWERWLWRIFLEYRFRA